MNVQDYFSKQKEIIDSLPWDTIEFFKKVVQQTTEDGGNVFVVGNGGSLLNAQHLCQDYLKNIYTKFGVKGKKAKFLALGSNPGLSSAIENDLSHSDTFIPELFTYSHPGDILIGISVSGTSPNIMSAMRWAEGNDLYTVSITGNKNLDKGINTIAELPIIIQDDSFHYCEDLMMSIFHYIIYNTF